MSIRMPMSIQTAQMLLGLQRTQDRIAQNTQRISTGSRLTSPADDPSGAATVLDLGNAMSANTQYQQQATAALSYLQGTETAVSSVSDAVSQLIQLGQQGLSSLPGASGRAALASTVDGIRTYLGSLANTQLEGKYVFSGTTTLTKPFTLGATGTATYNGNPTTGANPNTYSLQVSNSASVTLNLPGDTFFYGSGGANSNTDLFKAVTDLRDGLASNNTAQIQTAYNNLQAILPAVSQALADLGGRESMVQDLQSALSAQNQSLQEMQNGLQDTNYPETITKFTSDQTVQNATLNTLAKAGQQANLFNFLT